MRRALIAPVAAAVVALAIAGCGGGSTTTSSAQQAFDPAAIQQLQSCLAKHGVKAPQVGTPPSGGQPPSGQPPTAGTPSKKMQRAFEACRQYAPQGGPPALPSGTAPAQQSG